MQFFHLALINPPMGCLRLAHQIFYANSNTLITPLRILQPSATRGVVSLRIRAFISLAYNTLFNAPYSRRLGRV